VYGNWKPLGIHLGITYSRLQKLEDKYHADRIGAAMAMFREWQDLEGPSATRTVLNDALIHFGYDEVARTLFGN